MLKLLISCWDDGVVEACLVGVTGEEISIVSSRVDTLVCLFSNRHVTDRAVLSQINRRI